jgi:long-chain acyl-CoA synthetase
MSATRPWIAHYEESVPVEVEIPDMPLYQLVTDSAKNFPNNIAVRFVVKYLRMGLVIQSKLTYRELDEATNRFANALQALGVKKGDRVAIMLPNMPQQVIGFFGALKAGAVVVNTNPTYTPRELHHQLADSGAETIVMMSGLYEHLEKIRDKTDIKNVIIADVPDSLGWLFGKMVEKKVRARGSMADVPEAPDIHNFYKLINGQSARAVETWA